MSSKKPCFRHNFWTKTFISPIFTTYTPPLAIHGWKATDLSFNLAPSYRDLKDPTSRQNFEDTPGQIPKLILTLCHNTIFRLDNMNLSVLWPHCGPNLILVGIWACWVSRALQWNTLLIQHYLSPFGTTQLKKLAKT